VGKKKQQIKAPLPLTAKKKPRGKPFPKGVSRPPGPGRKKMTKAAKRAAEETRNRLKLQSPFYLKQIEQQVKQLIKAGAALPAIETLLELLNRAGITTIKELQVGGGEKPISFDETKTIEVKIEATPQRSASVLGIMARAGALTPGAASGGTDDVVDAEVDEVHPPGADATATGVPSS